MTDSITKTTHVRAPLDRVWRAISDHREFGQWFRVALDQPFQTGETGQLVPRHFIGALPLLIYLWWRCAIWMVGGSG